VVWGSTSEGDRTSKEKHTSLTDVHPQYHQGFDLDLVGDIIKDKGYCNLKQIYSNTMGEEVWGNICPKCGAYQGNHFVNIAWMDMMYNPGEPPENGKIVEVLNVPLSCGQCAKMVDEPVVMYSNYVVCPECFDLEKKNEEAAREEYMKAEEKRLKDTGVECPLCKKVVFPEKMVTHRKNGVPVMKEKICRNCSQKIHRSKNYHPKLK